MTTTTRIRPAALTLTPSAEARIADLMAKAPADRFQTSAQFVAALRTVTTGDTSSPALAVSTAKRSTVLPDTPTMSESGLPGFDVATWYCLLAPAGTPPPIVEKIRAALVQSLTTPEVMQRLADEGANVESSTSAELAAFMRAETVKWEKAVKVSGAKID